MPAIGMLPSAVEGAPGERGLFPLPRLCQPTAVSCRGHGGTRARRKAGRVKEANRGLSRLEQLYSGQLTEAACEAPAPAPTPCLRSVRPDAVAQVWEAACRHDPPLSEGEGVDALSDIAEDIYKYAVDELSLIHI